MVVQFNEIRPGDLRRVTAEGAMWFNTSLTAPKALCGIPLRQDAGSMYNSRKEVPDDTYSG